MWHPTVLHTGPLLGFPVQGVAVSVHDLSRGADTPLPLICSSLAHTVSKVCMWCVFLDSFVYSEQAVHDAEMRLLEPLTTLEV